MLQSTLVCPIVSVKKLTQSGTKLSHATIITLTERNVLLDSLCSLVSTNSIKEQCALVLGVI